jgi:ribosomal protein S27AE
MALRALVSEPARLSYFFEMPICPRCGDTLMAPEASQLLRGCGVRHLWACESCDHQFRTLIAIPN